ncbi:MAG TPA: glycoside hydrolase family 2 protein [Clostridiales bacterium]|nr:glycoside hydrolase family 2 protein [Clostridiales bacterium]
MRKVININNDWKFIKQDVGISAAEKTAGKNINLPHTWNGKDGQDGGNDYYRGVCWYVRELDKPDFKNGELAYIEFKGVNSSAEVYVNDEYVGRHDGGYSTFRFNITNFIKDKNVIAVAVDNKKTNKVYPQKADFTFYGGIYRDVNIIIVSKNHFDLDFFGSCGVKIDTSIQDNNGLVHITPYIIGQGQIATTIYDAQGKEVASGADKLEIKNVRLWNGVKDPYLYTIKVQLTNNGVIDDEIVKNIGFRTFHFDPNQGFFLNGEKYPLRGVCRHQDRPNIGNAILKEHHDEDMELISEVGANTVRLAHYQHDDYFYDLCDKYGMVVWAEIPYISKHMSEANDNAIQQMKELIYQHYHRPSIVCWGLSNEITISPAGKDRYDFHIKLNDLCHEIDKTRKTAIACYMPCRISNKLNRIPDLVSYNLYFGWYLPWTSLAGWKLDAYHRKYPNEIIGLAEYGAEGMPNLHSKRPLRGDNTEEYQAIYHEKMIDIINKRDYLWATHIWNMFDFGSDGRNQGGEPGMNHKGLVTFDRKTKKDSFYLYKAYWSDEPFVHICSKRFVNRTGKKTKIKVYTNQDQVSLYHNDKLIATQKGRYIFEFIIDMEEINNIKVTSGNLTDSCIIKRVKKKDRSYILRNAGKNKSWEK